MLQQGYLTLSDSNNHFVNPAYSLNLQDSSEANMFAGGAFSDGAWTDLFRQNVGIYVGRPTVVDDSQYIATSDRTKHSGSVSSNLYTRTSITQYDWNGTDAVEEERTSFSWANNSANVRIGLDREFAEGLNGRLVINRGILNGFGFASPLASHAQFSYRF